jgi:uncharacterized membrane protein
VSDAIVVFMGALHFADPAHFVRMMPAVLPYPAFLVGVSGVAAIAGGVGLSLREEPAQ